MSSVCPKCKHPAEAEALFCIKCGAKLNPASEPVTAEIDVSEGIVGAAYKPLSSPLPVLKTTSIVVMDTGKVIPLAGKDEFILGRKGEGTSPLPDIDLTTGGGLALSISRHHASIKVEGPACFITDLGSTNGTWVNGKKIDPHQAHPLNHGDMISLGRLLIQFLTPGE